MKQDNNRLAALLAEQRARCRYERGRTSPSWAPEQTCREAHPADRAGWCLGCKMAAELEGR